MVPIDLPPKLWLPPKPAIIRKLPIVPASFLPGMFPAGVAALRQGAAAAISQTAAAGIATDTDVYTFSTQSFGAAADDRIIAVAIGAGYTTVRTIDSVTIGGVTATVVDCAGTNHRTAVAYASVPTGTTGDVVVDFSGTCVRCAAITYRIVGANATIHDSDAPAGGGNAARSISIDVPANGSLLASAVSDDVTGASYTAGGVTETEQASESNSGVAGGHLNTAALLTALTVTYSSCRAICGVSWAPA